MSKIYCSAPWRGLSIMPSGKVRTCCLGTEILGNLNSSSIEEIVDGPILKKIQQELQSGTSPNCTTCYRDEEQGNYASMRQYYLKYYPITEPMTQKLEMLDVRWNNKCNLSCQYCTPSSSSVWEEKLQIKPARARKPYEEDLLDWILPQINSLREILLQGGEPMLMKQNYRLFREAPESCQFSIITNLSYDLPNIPCIDDLLDRPKDKVLWNISAENTGDKFEYIRNGADWAQFSNNLAWLAKRCPDTISMNMIYFLFSAYDLLDTLKAMHDLGVNKFNLLSIHSNPTLELAAMPRDLQTKALDVLYRVKQWHEDTFGADVELYPINGLNSIIEGLQNPNSDVTITKKLFFEKIEWHDSWVDTKFSTLWPELNQYLLDNLS